MFPMPPPEMNSTSPTGWETVLAPDSLGYRLRLLSQLLARRFQAHLDPLDLTIFHWVVLCCLWQEDGLAISAIGDRLQQVGGTMTGVLDRMETRGLIRRERDSYDRRIWRIWLTDSGRKLQDTLPPIAVAIRERAMQDMSVEERVLLSNLVNRAIANLS
jgi:MarR family transcriptional regulator, organic hydroperoxide resistance regulator